MPGQGATTQARISVSGNDAVSFGTTAGAPGCDRARLASLVPANPAGHTEEGAGISRVPEQSNLRIFLCTACVREQTLNPRVQLFAFAEGIGTGGDGTFSAGCAAGSAPAQEEMARTMAHILIVSEEPGLCGMLTALVRGRGHEVRSAFSGEAAMASVNDDRPDLVLLDLKLGGIGGIETFRRLDAQVLGLPIVILIGFANLQDGVRAMKLGATEFVSRPFDDDALLATIDNLLAFPRESGETGPLVGSSAVFRNAIALARRFAAPDINILLLGETGTGKELFARTIHSVSKRRYGPFIAVDCSTLAESLIESELFGHEKGAFTGAIATRIGRLEMAHQGTLFLDEISNLGVPYQAKLLRVLQERSMERVGGRDTIRLDIRVIAATNINLREAIVAGKFRQDLYYRLCEMAIPLPPLRERDGDIGSIAEHFVAHYARQFARSVRGISPAAMQLLQRYDWPGNVRELQNAMKSAVVMATDLVEPEHLPRDITSAVSHGPIPLRSSNEKSLCLQIDAGLDAEEIDLKGFGARAAEQAERLLIEELLRRHPMSGARMAKILGIDPKTLRMKLRKYGLDGAHDAQAAACGAASPRRIGPNRA